MASIILQVPHLLQRQPGECLAACAAMILTYLALPVNYNRLLKLLQVRPDIGAPSFNIRRLKTLGVVEVIYKQGTLVELHDHFMNNRPGIAFVQTGELPYWNKEENNHKKALSKSHRRRLISREKKPSVKQFSADFCGTA